MLFQDVSGMFLESIRILSGGVWMSQICDIKLSTVVNRKTCHILIHREKERERDRKR